jgi:hypothetical protein
MTPVMSLVLVVMFSSVIEPNKAEETTKGMKKGTERRIKSV